MKKHMKRTASKIDDKTKKSKFIAMRHKKKQTYKVNVVNKAKTQPQADIEKIAY